MQIQYDTSAVLFEKKVSHGESMVTSVFFSEMSCSWMWKKSLMHFKFDYDMILQHGIK